MVSKIILVGMMGAGKTTIGKLLSNKLGYDFVDLDKIIEEKSGVKINTIFEIEGSSLVPAKIAPAAQAFLTTSTISSLPKAAMYAAVQSPAPVESTDLKSGGTISTAPSFPSNLAGKLEEVKRIYFAKSCSKILFASLTSISFLLTTRKSIL
ncbi:MAG: hypothetical protein EBW59_06335 [Betaproteobacteria bacterium]|nr:hypothetical protein [Betaproteobacteria bacterium]